MEISLFTFQHFMVMFHDREDPLTTLSTINCILHVLLRYFHLTNFFWMFVEGRSASTSTSSIPPCLRSVPVLTSTSILQCGQPEAEALCVHRVG